MNKQKIVVKVRGVGEQAEKSLIFFQKITSPIRRKLRKKLYFNKKKSKRLDQ
jgi:hypothetical protein